MYIEVLDKRSGRLMDFVVFISISLKRWLPFLPVIKMIVNFELNTN